MKEYNRPECDIPRNGERHPTSCWRSIYPNQSGSWAGRLAITGVAKHVHATSDRASCIVRDYILAVGCVGTEADAEATVSMYSVALYGRAGASYYATALVVVRRVARDSRASASEYATGPVLVRRVARDGRATANSDAIGPILVFRVARDGRATANSDAIHPVPANPQIGDFGLMP